MDASKKHPKATKASLMSIRAKQRLCNLEIRKAKRLALLSRKRIRRDSKNETKDDTSTFSDEKVKEYAEKIIKKEGEVLATLSLLRRGFAEGTRIIDTFLSVDQAMPSLIGHLSGSDPALQLEAAWCLTNMAAGTLDHSKLVLKQAGSYCATYLSGSNSALQDQCAWAIGNLAGGSEECRETLRAQGVNKPLVEMLKSKSSKDVHSAAFALSNMAREKASVDEMITLGILPVLMEVLRLDHSKKGTLGEAAWVLTYIAASGEHEKELEKEGAIEKVSALVVKLAKEKGDVLECLTPLLRSLGNMCSGGAEPCVKVSEEKDMLDTLRSLINSEHHHIQKECLWVLSNLTATEAVAEKILGQEFVDELLEVATGPVDLEKEAMYCFCNLASHGDKFCEVLKDEKIQTGIIPFLKDAEIDVVHLALAFFEMIFKQGRECVDVFEESGGLAAMEVLEYHLDEELQAHAKNLLDTYLYVDDVVA